jgi:hypothetical protein
MPWPSSFQRSHDMRRRVERVTGRSPAVQRKIILLRQHPRYSASPNRHDQQRQLGFPFGGKRAPRGDEGPPMVRGQCAVYYLSS